MVYSYKNVNKGKAYVILNPIGVSQYIATKKHLKSLKKRYDHTHK